MAASMKAVTETGIELSNEERNLLSVAYKVSTALAHAR
jgi:14-3-3 protein beta/theta/zeta